MALRMSPRRRPSAPASTAGLRPACWSLSSRLLDVCASLKIPAGDRPVSMLLDFQRERGDVKANMNYESEFILRVSEAVPGRVIIDPSSFIAFHASQPPERCALKYR